MQYSSSSGSSSSNEFIPAIKDIKDLRRSASQTSLSSSQSNVYANVWKVSRKLRFNLIDFGLNKRASGRRMAAKYKPTFIDASK